MTFKQKAYQQFQEAVADKIVMLQQQLADLRFSAANETKSTVGDKYETTRALLQSEQDIVRKKIQEALEQQALLRQINIEISDTVIRNGSLVKTNQGWFFISIAIGKIITENMTVMAISSASPLGKLLIGQPAGKIVIIQNKEYMIEKIL